MIGILGGSFDPVHFGHLQLALDVYKMLELEQVRLIPSRQPPHRSMPVASAEQRVTMIKLAIKDEPGLVVDECELSREGPSYSVDTLIGLRKELGDVPLCLIIGMDAFQGIMDWHHWRELFDLCHIIVAQRPGTSASYSDALSSVVTKWKTTSLHNLKSKASGYIYSCSITQLDISSSQIRTLITDGKSIKNLTPDAVIEFINANKIYQ